jgi:hypothetical protein
MTAKLRSGWPAQFMLIWLNNRRSIGLSLVKAFVELHGGRVEAHRDGLGRGSEFVVRLPLVVNRPTRITAPGAGRRHDPLPQSIGHRFLVVDDNQDAGDSLAMLLRLQGHEVRVAYSGMAALEMTRTYTPDVVFMDIGMPGMDGYEVARRLRQEDRRRTADAGFDHHLVKPPEPKALEHVLGELRRRD